MHDAAAVRELAVAPTFAVHAKAGDEVGAGRGDGAANVGGPSEVGAMSAGVGAASMVSGVDAAVAVRAGFVCERELHRRRGGGRVCSNQDNNRGGARVRA